MSPFSLFFFVFLPPILAQIPLPVTKDPLSLLYTTAIFLPSPLHTTNLHLSLGSSFTWLACPPNFNSSASQPLPCPSSLCNSFPSSSCSNRTCSVFPENPLSRQAAPAAALVGVLALPPPQFRLVGNFLFSCSPPHLLSGLAFNVSGLAALGRSNVSLPAQVSASLFSPRSFSLCLPSSNESGVVLFGAGGPYSQSLVYTALILNPVGSSVISNDRQPSDEYYINLTSIQVNGKPLPLNTSALVLDENGYGGTKLSTDAAFTTLESSIYRALVNSFVNESGAINISVTSAVKPFDVCYDAGGMYSTRVGPAVPTVDFVMEREDVFWRVFGGNSMVRIEGDGRDLWCLGFVDGGINVRTPIVIGGHQMQDNLLEFDLDSNRFGFSSSLLLQGATCSNLTST